ncbi:hypothetical protein AAFC00_006235 [Neodothiora populina]
MSSYDSDDQAQTVNACTGCNQVGYCSKKCQSQAWKREHKHSCKFLKDYPPLPSAIRAARELAVFMNSDADDVAKAALRQLEKHTVLTVSDDAGGSSDSMKEAFGVSSQATQDILVREGLHGDDSGQGEDYIGQIWRNSLTLVTPTFDPLGLALDPLICSANHSCDPNTVVVMDGPSISIRSLLPVRKDSEIFISYIDHTNPYLVRQRELRERYCFTCACTKCVRGPMTREDAWTRSISKISARDFDNILKNTGLNLPASASSEDPLLRLSALEAFAFRELETARGLLKSATTAPTAATIPRLESVLALCGKSTLYPPTRQPYAAARNELFAALLENGSDTNVAKALMHMVKIHFSIDPVLYPEPFHPVRVVHSWTLVRLLLYLYDQREEHAVTAKLVGQGFDFVVVIWRLLRELWVLVTKSHGLGSGFAGKVGDTVRAVAEEIGEANLKVLERDPGGVWEVFIAWKDAMEF